MARARLLSLLAGSVVCAILSTLSVAAKAPQVNGVPKKGGRGGTAPLTPAPTAPSSADMSTSLSDEDALKAAGLDAKDGARLIDYLRQRTVTDSDQGKIADIIKKFGADDFDERAKATDEIEFYGPAAVAALKTASSSNDPEVSYRARVALKRLDKIPHAAVARAAVRAIIELKPEGAARALIGFLPLAGDEAIASLIQDALVGLAVKDGVVDPGLVAALSDTSVVRRSAAYRALTPAGAGEDSGALKEVYPKLKEAIVKEIEPEAKFNGLWNAVLTYREKDFIPELIRLIPQVNRGRLWQIEDLLLQLAGSHPKGGRFLKSPESLATARDAWLTWWNEKNSTIDLNKFNYKSRILGVTEMIEMDQTALGNTRLLGLGPDLKEKWQFGGITNPNDFIVVGDKVCVVELNYQLSQRSLSGNLLRRNSNLGQIVNILKGNDDGMIVIGRNQVQEIDRNWKSVGLFRRNANDIVSGVRLPGGDIIYITANFQGQGQPNCFRLDSKLKEIKSYTLGKIQDPQWMDAIDDHRILVCESDRVAEYDLDTGKQTWFYKSDIAPTSCQRLHNGNTLIARLNAKEHQVIEVDPSGEIVWEYSAKNAHVSRARRR